MLKLTLLVTVPLALPGSFQGRNHPALQLASGKMFLEHVENGPVALRIEAESDDPLGQVQVLTPEGKTFLQFEVSTGRSSLSGFAFEVTEASLGALQQKCSEGRYEIRAWTSRGRPAEGGASLSFDMPAAPQVLFPPRAAIGVPARNLIVRWLPQQDASGYYLELEQDDNDGLAVHLPPGRTSFRIPNGFLVPGVEAHLEVAAVGANGNRTVAEVPFTTL